MTPEFVREKLLEAYKETYPGSCIEETVIDLVVPLLTVKLNGDKTPHPLDNVETEWICSCCLATCDELSAFTHSKPGCETGSLRIQAKEHKPLFHFPKHGDIYAITPCCGAGSCCQMITLTTVAKDITCPKCLEMLKQNLDAVLDLANVGTLSESEIKRIHDEWESEYTGPGKVMIGLPGMKMETYDTNTLDKSIKECLDEGEQKKEETWRDRSSLL